MNKAARAKALARGGQVLLADLQGASESMRAEPQGSGWMLSWRGTSPGSTPRGPRTISSGRALQLPPQMAVDTAAGTATASPQALDGVTMRGFGEKVGIAELVAELPGEGSAAVAGSASVVKGAGDPAAGGRGSAARAAAEPGSRPGT